MEVTELDTEYVVADEAFDIHPPHPDVALVEWYDAPALIDIPF